MLKPTLLHGGNGVVPGWTVGPDEWRSRLTGALDGPYVMQERIRPVPEVFPADEGQGTQDLFPDRGVFLTDPQITGGDHPVMCSPGCVDGSQVRVRGVIWFACPWRVQAASPWAANWATRPWGASSAKHTVRLVAESRAACSARGNIACS